MALRFDCNKIIPAKIFSNYSHRSYSFNNISDVDVLPGNSFDNIMIMSLKIFNIFVGDTIFYKIVVML